MFGKTNNVNVQINLSAFDKSYHVKSDCRGKFRITLARDYIYAESNLGPVRLGAAPLIHCSACGIEFLAPEFSRWLDREISKRLILSRGLLTKKQLKFLRLDFDLTQEELGRRLGLRKEQLAKMENAKYDEHMSVDKQFRLKFLLAKILHLEDLSQLHEETEEKEVTTDNVVPTKSEIQKIFGT